MQSGRSIDRRFNPLYDSLMFGNAYRKVGALYFRSMPCSIRKEGMNLNRPNEVFISSFRGHVKAAAR